MSTYAGYQNWKGWGGSGFGACSQESAAYFAAELTKSGITKLSGVCILEIGFGNAEFAGWARSLGAEYVGTELIDELVQQGLKAGLNVRSAKEPFESFLSEQSLDVVAAFDVFEHMDKEKLLQTLRSVHRVLRPGGRLVARVPSGDSPFARAIQYGDATHCLVIGSSMVRQFADETGFRVDCVREPAFPLRGLGAKKFLRRTAVRLGQKLAFGFIRSALMGGGTPVLTPNMVFVLVRA